MSFLQPIYMYIYIYITHIYIYIYIYNDQSLSYIFVEPLNDFYLSLGTMLLSPGQYKDIFG